MTVALYKLATQENLDASSGLEIYLIEGKSFIFKAVEEDEVKDLIKDGWSLTTTEASEEKEDVQFEGNRNELIDKLTKAGVKFDSRLGNKKLQALVDELD